MKADILDMKKLGFVSVTLIGLLLLSACSGSDQNNNQVNETEKFVVKESVLNPLVAGSTEPVQTVETDAGTVNVYYAGLGYPSKEEQAIFDGKEPAGGPLVGSSRIIGIAYEVTNTTDKPVKFTQPVFGTPLIDGKETKAAYVSSSLTSLAGYDFEPYMYMEGDEVEPDATLTWSYTVFLPETSRDKQQVTFTQPVTWGKDSLNVEISLTTKEPPKPTITPPPGNEEG